MLIGVIKQKTKIGFKNVDDFESYINAIGNTGYDSDDVIFTGWLYKLNAPEFKKLNRSQYGKSAIYMQEIVEYHGQNCYIPTSGNCFIKCNKFLTARDYTGVFLTFIRTEQRRSSVLTSGRIQSFCRNYNLNTGCFDGTRINRRNITHRNTTLKINENRFCLLWKSDRISSDKTIKELKDNFKVVDNIVSDKDAKSFIKYEYAPKKVQSQLTNMFVYFIETFNSDTAVPYANCINRKGKISGK